MTTIEEREAEESLPVQTFNEKENVPSHSCEPNLLQTDSSTVSPCKVNTSALRSRVPQLMTQLDALEKEKKRLLEVRESIELLPYKTIPEAQRAQDALHNKLSETKAILFRNQQKSVELKSAKEDAVQIAARVHRLENHSRRTANFLENQHHPNTVKETCEYGKKLENDVAEVIRVLNKDRMEALHSIQTLRERIKETSKELRRGHVREPQSVEKAFAREDSAQKISMERCSTPRASADDKFSEAATDLIAYNLKTTTEREEVQKKIKRFLAEKGKLEHDLFQSRAQLKKDEEHYSAQSRTHELVGARTTRSINELHGMNAALLTTVQLLMTQLNSEHYGTRGGPTTATPTTSPQRTLEAPPNVQFAPPSQQPPSLNATVTPSEKPGASSAAKKKSSTGVRAPQDARQKVSPLPKKLFSPAKELQSPSSVKEKGTTLSNSASKTKPLHRDPQPLQGVANVPKLKLRSIPSKK